MTSSETSSEFRLRGDVIPLHYDLSVITVMEENNEERDFYFTGQVKIRIKCLTSTNTIKINARKLTIDGKTVGVKLLGGEDKPVVVVKTTSYDEKNEFFNIRTLKMLEENCEYLISISFEGPLTTDLVGYYYSNYSETSQGKPKFLAVTHFEPSDARQAFPCFDEPDFKATFSIKLGHHKDLKAVSNMPLKSTCPLPGKARYVWSEFQKSMPMSTYIVAYMISDFKFISSQQQLNDVTFRVWARREAMDQTSFPAAVGPRFLKFYEDYFDMKYPLPKQDLVAVPDFKIGAMENWGMITFREASLLLDENTTSNTGRLHIASIIAHELAHMWFGNLVTMKWWTDLWLKEGFATYMAQRALHKEFPEWNSLDFEAIKTLLRVFDMDSLMSSHPVSVPIKHPREVAQIFDTISYYKGSYLLRMMNLFLGEEVFRQGISLYLRVHQFSNAEQDDLFSILTDLAKSKGVLSPGLSVDKIMDSWSIQTGYPLVTVDRDYEGSIVKVSQKRFLAVETVSVEEHERKWWIPLSYSTEKEPNFAHTQAKHWLPKDKTETTLEVKASKDEWIIFNNRASGLYKVNYDTKNWQLIIDYLHSEDFEKIDIMNRALLIVDSMDLANNGMLDYAIAMKLIKYISKERSYVIWYVALNKLKQIKTKLCRTSSFGRFKALMKRLLIPLVKTLVPIEAEPSFENGQMLSLISEWAIPLGLGQFTTQATALFNRWSVKRLPDEMNPIPKDIRAALYAHAVENGDENVWYFLWERYQNANVVAERNNILMALAHTREVWLLNKYLDMTLNEKSGIRKQDAFIIFQVAATQEVGFYVAQKFFFRNIHRISDYFGANSNIIGQYFTAIASQMIYELELEELRAFAKKHEKLLAPASLGVAQALEAVELNIKWVRLYSRSITAHMNRDEALEAPQPTTEEEAQL